MACRLTELPLLFRADSGLCSLKTQQEVTAQATALDRETSLHHQDGCRAERPLQKHGRTASG